MPQAKWLEHRIDGIIEQKLRGQNMTDDNHDHGKKSPKLTLVQQRDIESGIDIALYPPEEIAYQHTVFCQTCLPYRNPGDDVREWRRQQGQFFLLIEAGQAYHPEQKDFVKVGLPFDSCFCAANTRSVQSWSSSYWS